MGVPIDTPRHTNFIQLVSPFFQKQEDLLAGLDFAYPEACKVQARPLFPAICSLGCCTRTHVPRSAGGRAVQHSREGGPAPVCRKPALPLLAAGCRVARRRHGALVCPVVPAWKDAGVLRVPHLPAAPALCTARPHSPGANTNLHGGSSLQRQS